MMCEQTFKLVLTIAKPEAEALARVAQLEIRDMRQQAAYLLREALMARGELKPPAPADPNGKAIVAAKEADL